MIWYDASCRIHRVIVHKFTGRVLAFDRWWDLLHSNKSESASGVFMGSPSGLIVVRSHNHT